MSPPPRFHLAVPVDDLEAARRFYGELFGCPEGRSADTWVDFDFFGHQLVTHLVPDQLRDSATNPVDGDEVPVPHFGVLIDVEVWQGLASRLRDAGVAFVLEPHVRFAGRPGEQHTMFLRDPAGNAIELKAFADDAMVFASDPE
ncbi:MAG: VOC family protein [Acidimicrobiales bacterium]|nr:VOC family protein [Acidimicrobiales bacterium]